MKKILSILMIALTMLFLVFTATAVDGENYEEENLIDILGEDFFVPDEEVEPFDLVCYDPVINHANDRDGEYADESSEEGQDNSASTYIIGDRTEDKDIDLSLTGLNKTEIEGETDGTHFKNIINVEDQTSKNRAYLYPIIDSRYDPFPDGHELYVNMQGSCTDGEYVYYAFFIAHKYLKNPGDEEYTKDPLEICIVSGYFDENDEFITTAIRFSGDMIREGGLTQANELKHANDITYNSLQDKLVISCSDLGYHNMVYLMDAAYFRGETDVVPTTEKHALSCMISAIAYSERYNKYVAMVAATDAYFVYFDRDFNLIGGFNNVKDDNGKGLQYEINEDTGEKYALSHQGIACDENYIYATYCEIIDKEGTVNDEMLNTLVLFDWEGNRVKEINLEFILEEDANFPSGRKVLYEIEGISILNDRIAVGFNAFWRKSGNNEYLKPYFYQYDMSHLSFNIKYCPDENVANYVNNNGLRNNTVIHGISTMLLYNTYMKNGYRFAGWHLYSPETNRWRYKKGNQTGWYVEGSQPAGYEKILYAEYSEETSVKQTVPAGWNLLLCAVWEVTDKFYVSYDYSYDKDKITLKDGCEDDIVTEVTYGIPEKLAANMFEKTSAAGNPVAFKGWNPYSPEVNKWYYESADKSHRSWYIEGEEPTGYTKVLYTDQVTVKQTTKKGGHITMYAVWDEFIIYYDANGQLIKPMHIKMPTVVHKGGKPTTQLNMYEVKSVFPCAGIQTPAEFEGYYQYLVEDQCWRYVEGSNDKVWLPQSDLPRYIYEYSTISNGLNAGRRVVFSAAWTFTQ